MSNRKQLICIGGTNQVNRPPYTTLADQWVSANLLVPSEKQSIERCRESCDSSQVEKKKLTNPVNWEPNIRNLLKTSSGDIFGLNEDSSTRFLDAIETSIYNNERPQVYIAHSRGCGLAILTAFEQYKKGKKIERLILMDPVSKNQGKVRESYAEKARKLASEGTEIIVYMACGERQGFKNIPGTGFVYESYCDLIGGTEKTGTYSQANPEDENIKFITLNTQHEGMYDKIDWSQLKEKLLSNIPFENDLYGNLDSVEAWLGDKGINNVVSEQYIKGRKTANEISGKSKTLKNYKSFMKKERWRTLIHKYAQIS